MEGLPSKQKPEEIENLITQYQEQKPAWYERKAYLVLEKDSVGNQKLTLRTIGLFESLNKKFMESSAKFSVITRFICDKGCEDNLKFIELQKEFISKNIKKIIRKKF